MNPRLLDAATTDAADIGATVPWDSQQLSTAREGDSTASDLASLRWERSLFARLLDSIGRPQLRVVLWDGTAVGAAEEEAVATLRIHDRGTLWKLVVDPTFQFGVAYSDARLMVEGDLLETLAEISHGFHRTKRGLQPRRLSKLLHRPHRNSLKGSRENIHRHYDLGNDFYKLWLDEQLVYTCAFFPTPNATLEEAQIAKMDYVCRKIWLRPGERVIEAGCGWGALALHMAKHYGVKVRAFNISKEQLAYARERAKAEGLQNQVEFIEDDWRSIRGTCDAFMSVGMLEHVGRRNYVELGRVIDRCLTSDGRGLIHSIGQNMPRPFDLWTERYIFPGAYPPTLREMTDIFQPRMFSILDVENIRRHYAETLRNWLARFERNVETVRTMFDDRFVRMWRLYLAASATAFETGNLQLFQVVFARPYTNQIPINRAHQLRDLVP